MSGGTSGSVVNYRAGSEAEAHTFNVGEPSNHAGERDRIEIMRFKAALGKWVS